MNSSKFVILLQVSQALTNTTYSYIGLHTLPEIDIRAKWGKEPLCKGQLSPSILLIRIGKSTVNSLALN